MQWIKCKERYHCDFFVCYFSYKLWYNYLKLRRKQVKGKCITDPAFEEVNNAFERSLVFMHKVIMFLTETIPRPLELCLHYCVTVWLCKLEFTCRCK